MTSHQPGAAPDSAAALVALPRLVQAAFAVLALVTVAAVFYENVARVAPARPGLVVAAGLFGAVVALVVGALAPAAAPLLQRLAQFGSNVSPSRALVAIVAGGLLLRLASAALMGPVVTSDGAVYLGLARRLLEGRGYVDPRGDLAYWPPGFPMSLAAAAFVIGPSRPAAAILAVNLVSYLAATAGAFLLGRWLYGRAAGLGAALLIAIWPNLVLGASGAAKEMPALGLLTLALALYVYARRGAGPPSAPGTLAATLGSGACLGMASLVQPALMFLPLAFALAELLHPSSPRQALVRLLLLLAAMATVIAPWTLRNAAQLGVAVPIATNGGDVLYRANNPQAVPGYLAAGPVDLRQYPEVERSRLGTRLAIEWIAREPHRFLALSWQRLLHFSGDNSTSAYDAFRRDESGLKSHFVALKAVSNAAWLALWLLIVLAIARGSLWSAQAPGAWLLVLSYLYLAAMDSIAESGARHHVPFAGVLAVLAAAALASPREAPAAPPAQARRSRMAEFIDFAAVGAVGTAAHFATLIVLVQSFGWPAAAATTAGFLVGAIVNYGLNHRLTFRSSARHAVAAPRFLVIAALSMLLNLAIVWLLVHWQAVHYLLGQAVATLVVLVVNFVANRTLTFAAPRPA